MKKYSFLIICTLLTGLLFTTCEPWIVPEAVFVNFNANGGQGDMKAQRFEDGEKQNLELNSFTRKYYNFAGWNTRADGKGLTYRNGQIVSLNKSCILYAQWERITYSLTFNANGGKGTMDPQTFEDGVRQRLNANEFSRDGYYFTSWNIGAYGSGTSYTDRQEITINQNTTLYAQWKQYMYVRFDANGGIGAMTPQAFKQGVQQRLNANEFSRDGYYFTGWNTAADGSGTSYNDRQEISIDQNITLYAQWFAPEYVDLGLPSGIKWATCNVGATTPEGYGDYFAWGETSPKNDYTWETYKFRTSGNDYDDVKFNKYNTSSDHGTIDNKTTLELSDDAARANWGGAWRIPTTTEQGELIRECNWTWTTQNGVEGYKVTSKTNGNSIFLPAAGYRSGTSVYDVGSDGDYWSSSLYESSPGFACYLCFSSGNVDWFFNLRREGRPVRAVCGNNTAAQTFTISFNANGGTGTMAAQTFEAGVSQAIKANTFTRSGYTFTGWNTAANGSGTSYTDKQSITLSQDITLYAQWKKDIVNYTVTFNANGGTGTMAAQTFVAGVSQTIAANAFTRSGYTFTGWNTNADGSGTSYTDKQSITISQNITLYAQWKKDIVNYTVTFNANGGTGTMAAQTFEAGVSQAIAANAFTRSGYTFTGWNTNADGSGTSYTDKQSITISQNITLYAQWKKDIVNYTVTFNANGGTGTMAAQTFEAGVSQALAANKFTRDGYTFAGWNTAADGNGTSYTDGQEITLTQDMTLYAQWEVIATTGIENGREWVDLGLPSGLKWAISNVGATTPDGYGDYFAWGETSPKNDYSWSTYKYCNGSETTLTKYNTKSDYGTVDNKTTLDLSDDAARTNWGGKWRMPTIAEQDELSNNCTWTWTTQNGINGYKVISKTNGNSIFLPAAGYRTGTSVTYVGSYGYYWTSSLENKPSRTYCLYFGSGHVEWYLGNRNGGRTVRAVFSDNDKPSTFVTLTFNTNGGSGTMAAQTFEAGVSQAIAANIFTRDGYTFAGWNTAADGSGTSYTDGQEITLTQDITLYAQWNHKQVVSGTENGHDYVDLGLPSGALWATCNVGATTSEGYGDYFAWGETEPKTNYDWSTYKYCNGSSSTLTKYNTESSRGTVDNKTILELSDDAARANWGGTWRMPTEAEIDELLNNCTWTWALYNGVEGYKVTSKTNGNSIFLPEAGEWQGASFHRSRGYYRSSSLLNGNSSGACGLRFTSSFVERFDAHRHYGRTVRAVCGETKQVVSGVENNHDYVDLGLPSGTKWATCNVGATSPEGYGYHFAWGETAPKTNYDWSTYKYCNGSKTTLTKYNTDSDRGTVDNKTILELSDDAARANWGGTWRMPTEAEIVELLNNCTWNKALHNGVEGYKVTSKTNGNSIFLPLAGSYFTDNGASSVHGDGFYIFSWSSSLSENYPDKAYGLYFTGNLGWVNYDRCNGFTVRAVCP